MSSKTDRKLQWLLENQIENSSKTPPQRLENLIPYARVRPLKGATHRCVGEVRALCVCASREEMNEYDESKAYYHSPHEGCESHQAT